MQHHSIHNTPLVPYIIAEKLTNNENEISYLEKRAERHYENCQTFREQINNPKRDCRQTLLNFMAHWLQCYTKYNYFKSLKTANL